MSPRRAPRSSPVLLLALTALSWLACAEGEAPAPEPEPEPERSRTPLALVEAWGDVLIDSPVEVASEEQSSDLRFNGDLSGFQWQALSGIENLRVENGRLSGRTTSDTPVILLNAPRSLGKAGDELWSLGLTVEASAGTRAGVHPMDGTGAPVEQLMARLADWPASAPLDPSIQGARTLKIELDDVFLLEVPPAQGAFRQMLIYPTNTSGADFAIEAVHVTFRRQHLASIPSGPGWHGLGEVFRETLISRSPESLTFRVTLPERPWLFLSVGSVEKTPPVFEVLVGALDGPETSEPPVSAASITVDEADTWKSERVDLSIWAGQTVDLTLAARGDDPGALAFWGTPTIRNSRLPEQFGEGRPQAVVVLLVDTLRSDRLEAWGHDRQTAPTLRSIAEDGVRFADAVAQATWTKASVPSMLTSLYPSTTGVTDLNDRISAAETTLAEAFRAAGYATFATSSVPFSGQLTRLHQGVEVLYEFGAFDSPGKGYHSKTGRHWIERYLEWADLHRDVPTFALIHAMDPHSPFRPEPSFDTLWSTEEDAERFEEQADRVRPFIKNPLMRRFMAPTLEELQAAGVDPESFVRQELAWYDGSIRALDGSINRLFTGPEFDRHRGRSLLAVVSDHGEEMLEHGRHWHGQTVYGEVANVPMILWGAGVPSGKVVEETVQNIDLMPTLLELAGLGIPERAQGRSLVPLMRGKASGRAVPAFTESHADPRDPKSFSSYAMVDEGFKLIWNVDAGDEAPEYELYDHDADPLNQNDVSADHPEVVQKMAEAVRRWRSWAEGQRLDEDAATADISAEELEQLRSLGYVD